MKNNEYNSLTEKLIQSGIIQSDNNDLIQSDTNIFNAKNFDVVEDDEILEPSETNRKRINNYDLELLENGSPKAKNENSKFKNFIYKIFPKLYEFKIAKDAIQKMSEMGIDTKILLDKSVPYGENEIRYKKLVKFIKYANEIQTKLKNKI